VYLEMPKAVKERKAVTKRIVTIDDIKRVLRHIKQAQNHGKISDERAAQYTAFVTFGHLTASEVRQQWRT